MAIIFAPILSRVYTEGQLGTYTLILTAVGMFESAICLRYDLILVSEKNGLRIRSLAFSCMRIAFLLAALITIGYTGYLVATSQLSWTNAWLGAFVFPALVCASIILILTAINNRSSQYKNIALASLTQGVVHNGLSALLGIFHTTGVLGLIAGRIAGYVSYIFVAKRTSAVRALKTQPLLPLKERIRTLEENKRQAIFSTPAVIISCWAYSIINLFISQLYGIEMLGLYSYSYRLLGLPLAVISANISRMFFRDASNEYQNKFTMKRSFLKMLIPVAMISVVMVIGFQLYAPTVFSLVLGERWREAGVFVQILAPMYGVRLLSNSFTNATIVVNKQFISLVLQVIYLIATTTLFIVCKTNSLDIYYFLKIMNTMFCAIYIVYFVVLASICLKIKKVDE